MIMTVPIFLMRNTQLPNHFSSNFWYSQWIIRCEIWIHMFDKVRLSLMIVGQILCFLLYMLSLLELVFKTYKSW